MTEFVFMLTHHDRTVPDLLQVYEQTRGTGLRYVGLKDVGATPEALAQVTAAAHADGLQVMLEVVSTSVDDELDGLRAAATAGVDWVLGGTHAAEGVEVLRGTTIRYCPFPGRIVGHPSVLEGGLDEIAAHAAELSAMDGVHGLDLLAYRHPRLDPEALTRAVVDAASGPVVVAGSIAGADQIRAVSAAGAWGFTIGGAIFEGALPGAPSVPAQLRAVLETAHAAGRGRPLGPE